MQQALLEVQHVTKVFPGIRALDDVHLSLRRGEVHALIGENGAGKSTLVKILTGVYIPTSGTMTFEGKEISFKNAIDAQQAGIVAIHQEASMFPELSVTENIYMGHHLRNPKTKKLDWKTMQENTQGLLQRMQLDINPDSLVKNLSVAQRHMVEIVKALSLDADLVIMDEPTSALTGREVDDLFRIVRSLKEEGKAILFISHKFEEIFEICDYYTVFRDGQYIGEGKVAESNEDTIINMMIGRSIDHMNQSLVRRCSRLSISVSLEPSRTSPLIYMKGKYLVSSGLLELVEARWSEPSLELTRPVRERCICSESPLCREVP